MMSEWLMWAVITFSLGVAAAVLLILLIKIWLIAFDALLELLRIKKSFIQWVWEKHHPKMVIRPNADKAWNSLSPEAKEQVNDMVRGEV